MILYIPRVPKCVVRDIAWSAGTGDGWTPWFKRRAFRIIEHRDAHFSEGRGQSAPVLCDHVPGAHDPDKDVQSG